jgi:hypothetical protein
MSVHGTVERGGVAHLADRGDRGRQIRTVVAQHRRVTADLRRAGRGERVGAEVIVEAPRSHLLAQHERFGRVPWVGPVRHHAVEARQAMHDERELIAGP